MRLRILGLLGLMVVLAGCGGNAPTKFVGPTGLETGIYDRDIECCEQDKGCDPPGGLWDRASTCDVRSRDFVQIKDFSKALYYAYTACAIYMRIIKETAT